MCVCVCKPTIIPAFLHMSCVQIWVEIGQLCFYHTLAVNKCFTRHACNYSCDRILKYARHTVDDVCVLCCICMCCAQLRDWLMEKDVVKVMKKGKRGKGYKYSKLPKDISTSMKHLE